MVRAGDSWPSGGCRDHLRIQAATDAGGYKTRDRAAGSRRVGPQFELPGLACFGAGRILRVGTPSQLATAAKSEGVRFFEGGLSPGNAKGYNRCRPCREDGRTRGCTPEAD